MNICENLEKLKKGKYLKLLVESENEKNKIVSVIFNKEKIMNFNFEYKIFSEENMNYIMNAVDELILDDEYVSLCCAMYLFMKNDVSIDELKPPEDGSLKSEFALMPPLIAKLADFCEDAIKRGVSKEILSVTYSAIDMYLKSNVRRKGRIGTSGYHFWLPKYAKGKLFRLGVFQFELREFKGENVLGVHIPNGTKLDVKENLMNFRYALEFFNKHYSEIDFKGFVCESWLLNPYIEEIMGKKTNITRFGDMFDRFEPEEEEGVFISVFKIPKLISIDELCEETSLQKNIKKFLKEGNTFKDYGGFISMEKFEKMCNEFLI